jgi:hypothetical protein
MIKDLNKDAYLNDDINSANIIADLNLANRD